MGRLFLGFILGEALCVFGLWEGPSLARLSLVSRFESR